MPDPHHAVLDMARIIAWINSGSRIARVVTKITPQSKNPVHPVHPVQIGLQHYAAPRPACTATPCVSRSSSLMPSSSKMLVARKWQSTAQAICPVRS